VVYDPYQSVVKGRGDLAVPALHGQDERLVVQRVFALPAGRADETKRSFDGSGLRHGRLVSIVTGVDAARQPPESRGE
jgi:hypothetical protein